MHTPLTPDPDTGRAPDPAAPLYRRPRPLGRAPDPRLYVFEEERGAREEGLDEAWPDPSPLPATPRRRPRAG